MGTHKRPCCKCDAVLIMEGAVQLQDETGDADFAMRDYALRNGWDARMIISGALLFTCPSCLLKAA